jgi:sulfocyanin
MTLFGKRILTRRLALSVLLAGSLGIAHSPVSAASTPTWVTTSGASVHLTIIAGYNSTNAGFNFNGAAHGQMVVTVPLGDTIDATFRNAAQGGFHDVVIIPYSMPLPGAALKPAFTGAASPLPQFRPGAGGRPNLSAPESFSFTASKAGTYMMICGISGHALAGMWDTFVVSSTAKTASVTFNQAAVAGTPPASTTPAKTSGLISTSGSTVSLTLIAGYNNNNDGFNFDGGAHGTMVVTVPLGAKVNAVFKNNVTTPHDVLIIPFQNPPPSHSVATAFPGASSSRGFGGAGGRTGGRGGNGGAPGRGFGFPKPGTPMPFSFVANKAGTYMIICGVPGHALAGMWDRFVVSPTAKVASITFTS